MSKSDIEWTDATWNPVAGCSIISPGCSNCYAMRMAARLEAMGMEKYAGLTRKSGKRRVWTGTLAFDEKALKAPLTWRTPCMVFVNSMSDLFQDDVPEEFIGKVWDVMKATPQHTYQILTKRSQRMAEVSQQLEKLPNVWLGVSVESEDFVGRLDDLRNTNALIRFVSFEPLLDAVGPVNLSKIDWAIIGGESGPKARPIEEAWVEEIQQRCRLFGTAFFFKQWGGTNKKKTGRLFKGRTWDEYPHAVAN